MRFTVLVAALLVSSSTAGAQFEVRRSYSPSSYSSLSIGLLDISNIADRNSGSNWYFGQGIEYRLSLEYAIRNQTGVGLSVIYATLPLDYEPASPTGSCSPVCTANARLLAIMAGFHTGGRQGLHQVLEIDAGAAKFSSFRTDDGDDPIDVGDQGWDLSISIGYGLGIGFTDRFAVTLVQDYGLIFHPDRSSGSNSRFAQKRSTRLGVRYGMGIKR